MMHSALIRVRFLSIYTGLQFKYFWITDSCPKTVAAIGGSQPFELLSLASIIAKMLHSYDMQRMSLRRAPRVTIP